MINTNSLGILGQFYFNIRDSFKSLYIISPSCFVEPILNFFLHILKIFFFCYFHVFEKKIIIPFRDDFFKIFFFIMEGKHRVFVYIHWYLIYYSKTVIKILNGKWTKKIWSHFLRQKAPFQYIKHSILQNWFNKLDPVRLLKNVSLTTNSYWLKRYEFFQHLAPKCHLGCTLCPIYIYISNSLPKPTPPKGPLCVHC